MRKFRMAFMAVLTCLTYTSLQAQCTLACYADINLTLDASGHANITSEDVLNFYGPECGALIVEPSSFDCSDIGSPVEFTVTDPLTGNSCSGNVHVRYNVGAMTCYADINVALGPSGTLTLMPDILLYDPPGACIPGAIISPSTVSCADIGTPVEVTITDPVSGNSCWSTIVVEDPRPTSCEIIVPGTIACGDSGIPFSVLVTGGYGSFDYTWEIKGNPRGWSILTGQGTDNITMAVGEGRIKLEVTITDLCGKKRKCSVKPECDDAPAMRESDPNVFMSVTREKGYYGFELFPNPATNALWVKYPEGTTAASGHLFIVNQLGQRQVIALTEQIRKGTTSLDIQDLHPGVYWLILEDAVHGMMTKKFIKL